MDKKRLVMCTSSGCIEYAPERYKNLGIEFFRILVFYDDKEFHEGLDLDPWHFFEYERTVKDPKNHLPHSSIPGREEVEKKFEEIIERGYEEVIVVTLSTGLGVMHDFIEQVAADYKDKLTVHVIDTRRTCFVEGMIAIQAQELVNKGVPTDEILKELNWSIKHSAFYGIDAKLDYLIYNGRLRGGKAFFGKLLKVVPALKFSDDGHIDGFASTTSIKKSAVLCAKEIKALIGDRKPEEYTLFHIYTGEGSDAPLAPAEEEVGLTPNHEAVIASPVTGVHTGPEMAGWGLVLKRRADEPLE